MVQAIGTGRAEVRAPGLCGVAGRSFVKGWPPMPGGASVGTGSAPSPAARPRRRWLWITLLVIMGGALLGGVLLRVGAQDHGGASLIMIGLLALLAVLYLAGELMVVLQEVQAREAGRLALAALPAGYTVSGRVRVSGHGRPVCIDHVVVTPGGDAFAVVVDGSTRPPAPRDPLDGVGPLLPKARAAAVALMTAARAGVLPDRLLVHSRTPVRPCILVVRRPMSPGERAGVLTLSGSDAATVL